MTRGRSFLLALLVLLAVAGGVGAGVGQIYLQDLPQIRFLEDYRPSTGTVVLDRKGRVITEFFEQKREPVKLADVSPLLVQAIIAVEDERFYEHRGVDPKAILRALWADLRTTSFAQGASTITQQLTRNLFLHPEKSVRRKVKEAILAVQIENHYAKEEILELYLNQIYLGSGVYGVEAAARKYFNRSAARLTLPQAALIAGLPRAPSAYDPYNHPGQARKRRDVVLGRLLDVGAITPEQYRSAKESDLGLVAHAATNPAPYAVELLRQRLEETYGYALLYQRGLEVHTTIDLDIQRVAEEELRRGIELLDKQRGWRPPQNGGREVMVDTDLSLDDLLPGMVFPARVLEVGRTMLSLGAGHVTGTVKASRDAFPYLTGFSGLFKTKQTVLARVIGEPPFSNPVALALEQAPLLQGALVCLDTATGEIRALTGGYDFNASQFNRAIQARRQPGSAIKPLLYAAAVEAGYTPASVIVDEPVKYWDEERKTYWEPQNYENDFQGETTLLEALTHSRNVVTVKLLSHVGVGAATRAIRRLGVESPMEPNLTLALGSSSLSPLELTSAYATIANGGIRCPPLLLETVVDGSGEVLEQHLPVYEKVMDPGVAYVVLDMMRNVVSHGTGQIARRLGFPVAAKTGTTDQYQDAWFVGFTPSLATGVWIGYDDNRSMGRGASGSRMAGPIWVNFMERTAALEKPGDFHPPQTVVFREIDPATGVLVTEEGKGRRTAFIRGTEPQPVFVTPAAP